LRPSRTDRNMRTEMRTRHYVRRHWLVLLRPVLRYSRNRDAYVLRAVGRKVGPVLRLERRRFNASSPFGRERRRGARGMRRPTAA
jgi:hypothetical protein